MLTERETLLSKSDFLRSLGCLRRLWLGRFRPDLKVPHTLSTIDRMETGKRIGDFARLRYPNGQFVPTSDDSAEATRNLIASGAECLFEATVVSEGRKARIDVLWKGRDGAWVIDEVKSSTIKEPSKLEKTDKAADLAFQVLTAQRAGLDIGAARLILIDSSYVWFPSPAKPTSTPQPGLFDETDPNTPIPQRPNTRLSSPFDPERMLGVVDMTLCIGKLLPEIERLAHEATATLASPVEPEVETNTHCKSCDYFDHCHQSRPKHDVIYLSGIRPKEVGTLRLSGCESIDQIPDEYGLTEKRLRMRDVIRSGRPSIGAGLRARLDEIAFPAAFIDYETSNPAFPRLSRHAAVSADLLPMVRPRNGIPRTGHFRAAF